MKCIFYQLFLSYLIKTSSFVKEVYTSMYFGGPLFWTLALCCCDVFRACVKRGSGLRYAEEVICAFERLCIGRK